MSTAIFSQGMKHRYRFSNRSWYSVLGMDLTRRVISRFRVHQLIDVVVDLVLQVDDLDHRFSHAGLGAAGIAGHPRQGGGGVGGQIVERRDLLDLGVDPGVQ